MNAQHDHHTCGKRAVTKDSAGAHTDPVCGMTVQPDSPHQAKHDGVDYRFCSAGCRTKFATDPAKYLALVGAHQEASVPAGTQYTCPMHPEILRDAPGNCPICGMALEPVMPALDDGENPELTDFRRRFRRAAGRPRHVPRPVARQAGRAGAPPGR